MTHAEAMMLKAKLDSMQARLDVLTLVLAALAKKVPAERAALVLDGLRDRVNRRFVDAPLSHGADAAVAADLNCLISALGGHVPLQRLRATLPG